MYISPNRNLALWYQASYICHSLHMPFEVLVIAHKIHFWDYFSYLSFWDSSKIYLFYYIYILIYIYLLAKLNSITYDIFFCVSIIKLAEQNLWSTILYGIIFLLISSPALSYFPHCKKLIFISLYNTHFFASNFVMVMKMYGSDL